MMSENQKTNDTKPQAEEGLDGAACSEGFILVRWGGCLGYHLTRDEAVSVVEAGRADYCFDPKTGERITSSNVIADPRPSQNSTTE